MLDKEEVQRYAIGINSLQDTAAHNGGVQTQQATPLLRQATETLTLRQAQTVELAVAWNDLIYFGIGTREEDDSGVRKRESPRVGCQARGPILADDKKQACAVPKTIEEAKT